MRQWINSFLNRINWRVRAKNPSFWMTLIPALALLVQAVAGVAGVTLDLSEITKRLLNVVNAAFAVLAVLGVTIDPTTAGVGDSALALTYDTPKADGADGED